MDCQRWRPQALRTGDCAFTQLVRSPPRSLHLASLLQEFFISLGYDATKWNARNLDTFVSGWAQREFGLSATDAGTVAGVVSDLTRYNNRRKPELLNSTTYSLWDYRECVYLYSGCG
jgi:hypothetical protein